MDCVVDSFLIHWRVSERERERERERRERWGERCEAVFKQTPVDCVVGPRSVCGVHARRPSEIHRADPGRVSLRSAVCRCLR